MKCENCGTAIKPDFKFCRECGVPLQGKQDPEIGETDGVNTEALLAQLKRGKEFLGEKFNSKFYEGWTQAELKREYFKLFEKVMEESAKRLKKLEGA
jgi:hypothetical protein